MRAVIIGNGDIKNYEYIKSKIKETDFIICADGGYNHAVKMGLKPNVLLGDFDSAKDFESVNDRIEYPVRKDFTDGEAAADYAKEQGFDDVLFLAMTGDRFDHTMADVLLLTKFKNGCVTDDNNEIYLLRDKITVSGKKGQTLSVIPINGDIEGVVTSGLEYPLCGETLHFSSSRGISNVMLGEKCEITVKRGMALVVKVERT